MSTTYDDERRANQAVYGIPHPSPEQRARMDADRARTRARLEEGRRQRADADEATIKARYMSTPGATEAGWQAERAEILKEYRRRQALAGDDLARRNAMRYG